MKNDKQWEHRD